MKLRLIKRSMPERRKLDADYAIIANSTLQAGGDAVLHTRKAAEATACYASWLHVYADVKLYVDGRLFAHRPGNVPCFDDDDMLASL